MLWPNGAIDTTQPHGLHLRIPHDDRCRNKRSARRIRAAKTYLDDETEATVRGFDQDGSLRARAPEHLTRILAAAARATFEDTAAAVNFVEMPLQDTETGARHVVTVAKGADRTPAALLKQAQARIGSSRLNSTLAMRTTDHACSASRVGDAVSAGPAIEEVPHPCSSGGVGLGRLRTTPVNSRTLAAAPRLSTRLASFTASQINPGAVARKVSSGG